MFLMRRRAWLIAFLLCVAFSAMLVFVLRAPFEPSPPPALVHLLTGLVSPGEFLCWSTIGGVFSGCPLDARGYSIWILGSALFWLVVLAIGVAAGRGAIVLVRRARRIRR